MSNNKGSNPNEKQNSLKDFEFDDKKQCFVKINPQKKQLLLYNIKDLTKLAEEEYKGFKALAISLEGISSVNEKAFNNCQFQRIYIVDIDKTIKELTFSNCPKLEKLVFGKGLSPKKEEKKIRYKSASLTNLEKITLRDCPKLKKINTIACPKVNIVYQGSTAVPPKPAPPKPAPVPNAVPPKPAPVPVVLPPKPAPVPVAVPPKPAPVPVAVSLKPAPVPAAIPPKPAPPKSVPNFIGIVRDFINEGTDNIVSKILSSNLDDYGTAVKLFDELLTILKNKDFANIPKNTDSPRARAIIPDFKSRLYGSLSSPYCVIIATSALKDELTYLPVAENSKKASLLEVARILPNITKDEQFALNNGQAKKIIDLYNRSWELDDFNNAVKQGISSAKNGDYLDLRDCTNDNTIGYFIKERQKDFTEDTKLLCSDFVNKFKDRANGFDNFVRVNSINALAARKTITKKSEEVLNTMQQKWLKLKKSLQENGGYEQSRRYNKIKLAQKASEEGQNLIKAGVLEERDLDYSKRANSEKFVKAYIRYLERSFSDLKDDICIFYFASDMSSQRQSRYSQCIANLQSKSKKKRQNLLYS